MVKKKKSLLGHIVTGTCWNFLGQGASQVVSLVTTIILARLLDPEDFGLVAMTYVVSSFAYMFATMGMGSAIVQRKEINDDYLSTAFWVSLGAGAVAALLMACSSSLVASFFQREELGPIVAVASISFVFGGVSVTHRSILTRDMAFKKIAHVEIVGAFAGSIVAVVMAMNGMGYWSLVFQAPVAALVRIPLFWNASGRWTARLIFCKSCFKDLFGFSSYILLANLVNFFNRNGDNIIIGRLLGASQLGYYDRAYTLMLKPLQYISHSVGRAMFPGLSSIQDDKEQVREIYLKMVKMISLITFPMMVGLSVISSDVILFVYGPKWEMVIPIFAILCYVGMFQSIGTTVGTIYNSQGRSDLAFKMTCIASPFIWLAFWIGTFWGIKGVAVCYAIVSGIWWLISHAVANSLINLKMYDFLFSLWPATVRSSIMGLFIYILSCIMQGYDLALIIRVFVAVLAGIISYIILLFYSKDEEIMVLKRKIQSVLAVKFS